MTFHRVTYRNLLAAAALLGVSSLASAGPLNDYNLILFGDLNVSGGSGHIEGKAFIGGNVVNASVFAQKEPENSTADTVKVVGNFASNNGTHIDRGYLAYEGSFSGPTNICNGNGLVPSGCLKQVTDGSLTAEKTSLFAQLQAESDYYKNLATSANTDLVGDMNNKAFTYTGAATDLVVFNITAQELTGPQWSLNMDFPTSLNVVINVSGSSFNAGNTKNGTQSFRDNFNNVLWNFYEATNLNFGDSWFGSVLALNATIATNSNLDGAVAAKSYVGNGEIHKGSWDYTPPVTEVTEPSIFILLLTGIGLIGLGRLRRR
ncbi:PEP-CTERM putative exosortase interaction domain protein [Cellvibrio sp. BR]|uniref:choice-of-anchor A family protein n=1 Tax=Cellvibrio sp. BR TaxID=1134474 RepID=UPI0002601262|nr:choice-of-anchor A family protein [Cellvibrio sp. BR]EIK46123.1 PEP-CTERM putative exosortase interaction domain protein [Cellvibrio sp. BR]